MKKILFCWVGFADLRASRNEADAGLGPIGQAATDLSFDEIVLLYDHPDNDKKRYLEWIKNITDTQITCIDSALSAPTHFGEIYEAASLAIKQVVEKCIGDCEMTYHLSPGTPAMAAVWIIIAKTRFPAALIESSQKGGVKTASIPFDISAEFIPDILNKPDRRLEELTAGLTPEAPEFEDIIHRSQIMKRLIAKARIISPRSVSVLIEGESGTGKELLAKAIHKASPRKEMPFVAVNCGAIPAELVESELFGHEKGAFTGADKQRTGYFEAAHQGTLFLDEIGELPSTAQVKILRVLQEKELTRVGSTKPIAIDTRVIAATNRNLISEISEGRFRSDLFYRIAVAVLKLPPLRDRSGDIGRLIEHFTKQINIESKDEPGFKDKKISVDAKNIMFRHQWPGNVRELQNTLRRAAVWTPSVTISAEDIKEALLPMMPSKPDGLLGRPISDGVDLQELIQQLAQHYLKRAMMEAGGNKTKAAQLVGLPNYQTFTNWMTKYNVN